MQPELRVQLCLGKDRVRQDRERRRDRERQEQVCLSALGAREQQSRARDARRRFGDCFLGCQVARAAVSSHRLSVRSRLSARGGSCCALWCALVLPPLLSQGPPHVHTRRFCVVILGRRSTRRPEGKPVGM